MAALLVGLSIMAVLLGAALPVWSQLIRREKEEELIFRGNQYARAINLYQRRYAAASPPSLDVLIEQRFLRRKFRDPLSPNEDGEFQLLYVNTQGPGARGFGAAAARGTGAAASTPSTSSGTGAYSTTPSGGIVGVASKNTGQSIRTYNGKTRYNEWEFVGVQQSTQAGPGGAARGAQRGIGPQRGTQPATGRPSGPPSLPMR